MSRQIRVKAILHDMKLTFFIVLFQCQIECEHVFSVFKIVTLSVFKGFINQLSKIVRVPLISKCFPLSGSPL